MQRLCKIVFLVLVLAWGAAGLRHAQGQRGKDVRQDVNASSTLEIFEPGNETASAPSRTKRVAKQPVTRAKDSEIEE